MTLKILELVSILCSALVAGMFFGPWVALTRSMHTFRPEVFLAVVDRLTRNMAPFMTVLIPTALLSLLAVLVVSYRTQPGIFHLTLTGFGLSLVALFVTVFIEVPTVKQIGTWTVSTLPGDWQQLRDRWGVFHLLRIVPASLNLALLVVAAIFCGR